MSFAVSGITCLVYVVQFDYTTNSGDTSLKKLLTFGTKKEPIV